MSAALVQAARDAGIRITLLDTCYLCGGFGQALDEVQLRFSDGDATGWAKRVDQFTVDNEVRLGAAVHSVRAVAPEAVEEVVGWARKADAPLHVHLSEQRAENDACLALHGCTPTQLLESHGALGPDLTAVHATHLIAPDVALLGGSRSRVCLCPTTEADLADGIGPAAELAAAGSPLALGSDGHSVIDIFVELQAMESGQRLRTETRGNFDAFAALEMATAAGHRALGWYDAGWLGVGARADLISLDLDSPRLAGVPLEAAAMVARSADVRDVMVAGRRIAHDGVHHAVPDVAALLRESITAVAG